MHTPVGKRFCTSFLHVHQRVGCSGRAVAAAASCMPLPLTAAIRAGHGTPAGRLVMAWRKSNLSDTGGNCVEVAGLAGRLIPGMQPRYGTGPALIYSRAE
jgi:Domain of unknown function (DUF397)